MVTTSRKQYHYNYYNYSDDACNNYNNNQNYKKYNQKKCHKTFANISMKKSKNKICNKNTAPHSYGHQHEKQNKKYKAIPCETRLTLSVYGYCRQLYIHSDIQTPTDLINIIFLYALEYFSEEIKHPVFVSINDNFEYKYLVQSRSDPYCDDLYSYDHNNNNEYQLGIINSNRQVSKTQNITTQQSVVSTVTRSNNSKISISRDKKKNRNKNKQSQSRPNIATPSMPITRRQRKMKVLVLGAALTGKSTIVKQFRNLYGRSFDTTELYACKPHITQNTIKSMKKLAYYSEKLESRDGNSTCVESHNKDIRQRVSKMSDKIKFTEDHYNDFMRLWNDDGIRQTYKFRNEFHLCDNTEIWFNNMHKYYDEQYVPTFKDILHGRQRTTGVNKTKIIYSYNNDNDTDNNQQFDIYDVGGTRNERRRWIHFFEWSDIVIFVVGLNGFCRLLWEDNKNNRLKEDIALFKKIINLDQFSNTKFFVLLNKLDVLIKDLKCYNFSDYFREFDSDQTDVKNVIEFIVKQLLSQRTENTKNKHNIHFIATSAIDTDSIKCVFDYISDDCIPN